MTRGTQLVVLGCLIALLAGARGAGGGAGGGGARGGAGGGAGGGGGAHGGGSHAHGHVSPAPRSMNQTPSMSRSAVRPRPQVQPRQTWHSAPGQRQTWHSAPGQRQTWHSAPGQTQTWQTPGPSRQGYPVPKGHVVPAPPPIRQKRSPADLNRHLNQYGPLFNPLATDHRKMTSNASQAVRNQVRRDHPESRNWFNDQFFERHHYRPQFHGRGRDWWYGASWGGVTGWFEPWGWSSPVYYDYFGYPQEMETAPESIPESVPTTTVQGDWLPLGVFAAGKDAQSTSYSSVFFQLAVNKAGEIGGTYYNSLSDRTYPLEGHVDKVTQKAAWTMSEGDEATLVTTGMYNLTQDVAPVQVFFPDGSYQTWVLVRVNE